MREQKNLIRRCKVKTLTLVVTALTMSFPVVAQEGNITLPIKKLSAQEVFENIQNSTSYKVAINGDKTDDLTVNITKSPVSVKVVLDRLLSGSGMSYKVDGNYIVITESTIKQNNTVEVNISRNITGTIKDNAEDGISLEGVTVELLDRKGKRDTTQANGRFQISEVPAGNQVVKLTSADGTSVRYREITVPRNGDAEVTLFMGGELLTSTTTKEEAAVVATPSKTTAYFRPNTNDHTIKAFSDEPMSQFTYIPTEHIGNEYLPKVGIKTNFIVWGTATANAAVEFGLARKWTMEIGAAYNPFQLQKGGINLLWYVQPEVRYWFCQRFEKHFLGLHGIYGNFNIGDVTFLTTTFEEHRYRGWGAGVGLAYGYHLPMGKRWAWEFTVGLGYVYLEYDKYRCYSCDEFVGRKNRHYFGPTKAGISLMFMIK